MDKETVGRVEEIRKRVKDYHDHENDPYGYFQGSIKEIREFNVHALEDVEFLLSLLKGEGKPS